MKTKRSIILSIPLILIVILSCVLPLKTNHDLNESRLVRVIDGDSFVVRIDGKDVRLRLLNVDTPESCHPDKTRNTEMGRMISAVVKEMVPPGTEILLEADPSHDDKDRYSRFLRYMFVPGHITGGKAKYINFNVWLTKNGMSKYYTKYGKSGKYDAEFRKAEQYAQEHKLNIWRNVLVEDAAP